jgi:probable HAF family extracellular repeat protein
MMKAKYFAQALLTCLLINTAAHSFGRTLSISLIGRSSEISRPVLFYGITELGALGGTSSFARDINNRGQVTGNASVPSGRLHAFLWENGVMRDLGFLQNGVEFSRGFALNEHGVVTGESDNDSSKAFVFDPAVGVMTPLSGLIASNPDNMNIAGGFGADINDSGQIVGTMSRFTSPTSLVIRGFTFDKGNSRTPGSVRDLGSIDGLTTTQARAWGINSSGVAVGRSLNANGASHATLWANGTAVDLASLGGPLAFSEALRINDRGQAVGRSTVVAGVTGQNAVVWEDVTIRDLGRFPGLISHEPTISTSPA